MKTTEKQRAAVKRYKAAHPECQRECNRRWKAKHPDWHKGYMSAYMKTYKLKKKLELESKEHK